MKNFLQKDIDLLRGLAQRVADISALPIQKEKAELWRKVNDLEMQRPVFLIEEIPWHEMNVDDELTNQTDGPWLRGIETYLRREIYKWKHMPADMVVNDYIPCPLVIHNTEFGISEDVDIVKTDETSDVVSRHFNPQIVNPEDIEKIKMPVITHDEEATEKNFQNMCDIFDGIMPVKKEGIKHIWFTPWDFLIRWWGIEQAMMDMVLRPQMVDDIVSKMVDSSLCGLEQLEKLNLLTSGNDNNRVGSGGYGYTGELDGSAATATSMWGCSNAQIFSEVSPEMHWEFALKHEMRWLEKWGMTYYGCCEPLDLKMDLMRKIPNLRKISMSPWIDLERAVKEVGNSYAFSSKPSPAVLAETEWNPATVRSNLKDFLDKAKGCQIEIIMKDISTVRNEPQRLWEFQEIAMELVQEF